MEIRRLKTLAVEIFKTLNEINPPYIKNIFTPKENAKVRRNGITVNRINTSRFSTQSLRSLGPNIWNNLPSNIKSETSSLKFQEYVKLVKVQMEGMHKHVNRKCSVVLYIFKSIKFLHIFIVTSTF